MFGLYMYIKLFYICKNFKSIWQLRNFYIDSIEYYHLFFLITSVKVAINLLGKWNLK